MSNEKTTPKKYEDLADRIKASSSYANTTSFALGVECALRWLDDHPEACPGRTITDAGLGEIWEAAHAGKGLGRLTLALENHGITVTSAPEPEPDPEEVRRLAQVLKDAAYAAPWKTFDDLAKQTINHGVKAPEDDDE